MSTHKAPWRTIYFRLEAPDAGAVSVVGDFNDWDARKHALHRTLGGVWECQLPLPPGRYGYHFLVDGARRLDPHCALREPRARGECCIIEVSPPEA